jgi:hypothetical protein
MQKHCPSAFRSAIRRSSRSSRRAGAAVPRLAGAGRGDRAIAAHSARRAGIRKAGRRIREVVEEIEEYERILGDADYLMDIIREDVSR